MIQLAMGALRDCVALLVIFLIPGTAIIVSFSARDTVPLSGLLARAFAINIIFWVGTTTMLKLAGNVVDSSLLLASATYALSACLIWLLRSRRLPSIVNDLPLSVPVSAAALTPFILLFAFLNGYTSLCPSDHWLIEQVGALNFPAESQPIIARYEVEGISRDGCFIELHNGEGRALITSERPDRRATLRYLVNSSAPGRFIILAAGIEESHAVPSPFLDKGREVRFQNQAVVEADLMLPRGEHAIRLRFRDSAGAAAPCTVLDFTGLTRDQFLWEFGRKYRFVTCVLMYDLMEAQDFVANLTRRLSIYHSSGTPEAPGYAVTNPPLSYLFTSFGYILMGESTAAINKVAFAILAASFLVSLGLMHAGIGRPAPAASLALLTGTLSLSTVLTAGVSLHFMTHFMFLCVLIAIALLRDRRRLSAAFFLMSCLSAWAGYYFTALALACYAAVWREFRRAALLVAAVTVSLCAFLAVLFIAGHFMGVLPAWISELLWENFRRFGTAHLYQAGSKARFFIYAILGTACMPLGLLLARDRRALYFSLFSVLYLATLLLAPSNEWKVHYLPTLCFPLMIAGGRGMALAARQGTRKIFRYLLDAVILGGSACALFYALASASRGILMA